MKCAAQAKNSTGTGAPPVPIPIRFNRSSKVPSNGAASRMHEEFQRARQIM
jgi:hypothetical protein